MEGHERPSVAQVPSTLRSEAELIREAVQLVASGGSPKVIVAGLRFGEELLPQARELAASQGVLIVPRWSTDEAGLDIVVERVAGPG